MVELGDILDTELLARHISDGYVRERKHPVEPLAILNYSEKTAYDRVWDDVTRQCRGLIYRTDTFEVVARPFPKFFNYGEHEEGTLDLNAPVEVTDKLDGSLGISYPTSTGWAVATRGSFESDQAIHATEVLQSYIDGGWSPNHGETWLWEIIYPQNRIVVDYGDTDDLFLLAVLDNDHGMELNYGEWPGPRTAQFEYQTLAEALAAEPRPNAEGYVINIGWDRVKLKQADYVALHRIVTGLNERTVWDHLRNGGGLDELVAPLPDEFHDWVREVAAELTGRVESRQRDLHAQFSMLASQMAVEGWDRKGFALVAQKLDDPWAMFALLDGKDITERLWKEAKPEAVGPSGRSFTEDNA